MSNANQNALSNTQVLEAIGINSDIVDQLKTLQGNQFGAKANEFLTALVNKIVYQRILDMDFANPFSKYDGFPIEYGDTIENIYVSTVKGYKFDKDADDPFKKVNPNVISAYVSINFEVQYCVTIQDVLIRRACLGPYGMSSLIEKILRSLMLSMQIDEYLANLIMLNNAELYSNSTSSTEGGVTTYAVEEIDVSALSSNTEKYAAIATKMIEVYKDMTLPSPDHNKRGVMAVSKKSDLLVIAKQSLINHIDLDYLAGVYNLNKVDLLSSILEVRSFRVVINDVDSEPIASSLDGDDIEFVILDTRGFDNHQALQDSGMIYNPKGKYTNHFLNNWKILSFRTDCQAAAFKVKYLPDNADSEGE